MTRDILRERLLRIANAHEGDSLEVSALLGMAILDVAEALTGREGNTAGYELSQIVTALYSGRV